MQKPLYLSLLSFSTLSFLAPNPSTSFFPKDLEAAESDFEDALDSKASIVSSLYPRSKYQNQDWNAKSRSSTIVLSIVLWLLYENK